MCVSLSSAARSLFRACSLSFLSFSLTHSSSPLLPLVQVKPLRPKLGYSELSAEELFEQSQRVIQQALEVASIKAQDVSSLGIATLRASFVTWNKDTGEPLHEIITWQDSRAGEIAKR